MERILAILALLIIAAGAFQLRIFDLTQARLSQIEFRLNRIDERLRSK